MISVVLSNFNGRRYLDRLLDSLRRQRGVEIEILVVDRESSDGSIEFLRQQPDVRLLCEPPTSGLVSGYSVGARAATGDLLFFANEDLWLDPDCLGRLAARIDADQRVAIADPWEWDYDGVRLHHAGVRLEAAAWDCNSPWPRVRFQFTAPLKAGDPIPFPCAGAFLIHRSCYDDLGGFDTGFFLDFEDVDLGVRAWQRRWKCVTVPEARVFHAVGASNAPAVGSEEGAETATPRRYISNRASLFILVVKTFSFTALPIALAGWLVSTANDLRTGRWRRFAWDLAALLTIARRLPLALRFRRANSAYNHYFPGERFFQDPTFRSDNGCRLE